MRRYAPWLASFFLLASAACDGSAGPRVDAGPGDAGGHDGDPDFVASCVYENTFAMAPECREYRGPGWDEGSVTRDCARVFLGMRGELRLGAPCDFEDEIGRCTVGDVDADGYVIVSAGDASACGAAQTGCETFAGGTFVADAACDACAATGDEGPGAVVPDEPDCRDPLPGEPAGTADGQVCTPVMISGSTEPGRFYPDYADCDVVRTQRPYYGMPTPPNDDPDDPRLDDAAYRAELEWVRAQAEASACACCHTGSATPDGAALWDTEAGPLWIDTVSDEALAMLGGFTDSAAFGFFAPEDNNGFDRSTTGLPTTDAPRLRAFVERELARRGLTLEEARGLPPFAPFFRELIEFEPDACAEGVGLDPDGAIRWTGGGARRLWVLEADAQAPGVPPNWDLPGGTLWAIRTEPEAPAMSCGMAYGELDDGVVQRVPADGEPPPLVSGETYFLYVERDLAQPITRCLFTAP
jgi:hypothetical protein